MNPTFMNPTEDPINFSAMQQKTKENFSNPDQWTSKTKPKTHSRNSSKTRSSNLDRKDRVPVWKTKPNGFKSSSTKKNKKIIEHQSKITRRESHKISDFNGKHTLSKLAIEPFKSIKPEIVATESEKFVTNKFTKPKVK